MKKVFGFLLIGFGIITLIKAMGSGMFNGGAEWLGGLIGISLVCFLPGYLLLRNKTKFYDSNNN